jgi:gluconokinase
MSTVASQLHFKCPPLIVMGASGCGKSSVGEALAKHFGVPFIEGDAMHPASNIAKMSAGIPLNDEDRGPWLDALAQRLSSDAAAHGGAVASCSALKIIYRDRLQAIAGEATKFVFLDCKRETLERNQSRRKGHFMPKSLLDSQLATLEPPYNESRSITVNGNQHFSKVIQSILEKLSQGA